MIKTVTYPVLVWSVFMGELLISFFFYTEGGRVWHVVKEFEDDRLGRGNSSPLQSMQKTPRKDRRQDKQRMGKACWERGRCAGQESCPQSTYSSFQLNRGLFRP